MPCICIIIIIHSARSLLRKDSSFIKANIKNGFIWPIGGFGTYVIGWIAVAGSKWVSWVSQSVWHASFSVYHNKMNNWIYNTKKFLESFFLKYFFHKPSNDDQASCEYFHQFHLSKILKPKFFRISNLF